MKEWSGKCYRCRKKQGVKELHGFPLCDRCYEKATEGMTARNLLETLYRAIP